MQSKSRIKWIGRDFGGVEVGPVFEDGVIGVVSIWRLSMRFSGHGSPLFKQELFEQQELFKPLIVRTRTHTYKLRRSYDNQTKQHRSPKIVAEKDASLELHYTLLIDTVFIRDQAIQIWPSHSRTGD